MVIISFFLLPVLLASSSMSIFLKEGAGVACDGVIEGGSLAFFSTRVLPSLACVCCAASSS